MGGSCNYCAERKKLFHERVKIVLFHLHDFLEEKNTNLWWKYQKRVSSGGGVTGIDWEGAQCNPPE